MPQDADLCAAIAETATQLKALREACEALRSLLTGLRVDLDIHAAAVRRAMAVRS